MASFLTSTRALGLALVGLVLLTACANTKIVQVGSHKVTVSRHGFEKRLVVDGQAQVPTLEYAGVATDGKGLKVKIRGDEVKVNDENTGRLKPGDSVFITDDGVAVNSLDYGESEKYLRANNPTAETSIN